MITKISKKMLAFMLAAIMLIGMMPLQMSIGVDAAQDPRPPIGSIISSRYNVWDRPWEHNAGQGNSRLLIRNTGPYREFTVVSHVGTTVRFHPGTR